MSLVERLTSDMKAALKAREELRLTVLRSLIATLNNKAIEKRAKTGKDEILTDEEASQALMTEAKRRKESAAAFTNGSRQDLADKELAELVIIEAYLPKQLSKEETEAKVVAILAKLSIKEFGPAMKAVMAELRGQADSKLVTEIVKQKLG